jgi:ABC-type sulfate transport system permease subunit
MTSAQTITVLLGMHIAHISVQLNSVVSVKVSWKVASSVSRIGKYLLVAKCLLMLKINSFTILGSSQVVPC